MNDIPVVGRRDADRRRSCRAGGRPDTVFFRPYGRLQVYDQILDEIPELIYIVEDGSYNLLYANRPLQDIIGDHDYQGKKCYAYLQGFTQPCPFCMRDKLTREQFHVWEHYNDKLNRYYQIKEKLILWQDREARLEIAFDITEGTRQRKQLVSALSTESFIAQCARTLYENDDLASAMSEVLSMLGSQCSAERTRIFELLGTPLEVAVGEDNVAMKLAGREIRCTYEWLHPEKAGTALGNPFANLPMEAFREWLPLFRRHRPVIINSPDELEDRQSAIRTMMIEGGIRSLLAFPLSLDHRYIGAFSIINFDPQAMKDAYGVLDTLNYFLASAILRRNTLQELERISLMDRLTGLYNRNALIHHAEHPPRGSVGIVYLDLNGLKVVNDTEGHTRGDEMLRTSARLLQEHFPRARCYRVGGDEFVALWHGVGDKEFTAAADALRETFGSGKAVSGAVGAIWSETADRLMENISTADAQMYSAKKAYYRRQIRPGMTERRIDDAVLALASEARVRHSLRNGEFRPRWALRNETPNHTFSSLLLEADFIQNDTTFDPGVFLSILEEAGHTHLLDRFLFFCACRRLASWKKDHIPGVPIHLFLSTHTLRRPQTLRDMDRERRAMNVSADQLRLHPLTRISDAAGRDGVALLRSMGYCFGDAPDPALPELDTFLAAGLKALNLDESGARNLLSHPHAVSLLRLLLSLCRTDEAPVKQHFCLNCDRIALPSPRAFSDQELDCFMARRRGK